MVTEYPLFPHPFAPRDEDNTAKSPLINAVLDPTLAPTVIVTFRLCCSIPGPMQIAAVSETQLVASEPDQPPLPIKLRCIKPRLRPNNVTRLLPAVARLPPVTDTADLLSKDTTPLADPTVWKTVTDITRLPDIPAPHLQTTIVLDPHAVASPPLTPYREPALVSLPPKPDPQTVIVCPPLVARLAAARPDTWLRSNEAAAEMVPERNPAVSTSHKDRFAPACSRPIAAVSLSHKVPAAPVPWCLTPGVCRLVPKSMPCKIMLKPPIALEFLPAELDADDPS
jgi:hypothetical protein